jgi:TonB family protein
VIELLMAEPDTQINIENVQGAPMTITRASVKSISYDGNPLVRERGGPPHIMHWVRPTFTLINNTALAIKEITVSVKNPSSRSFDVLLMEVARVEPHGSVILGSSRQESDKYFSIRGNPAFLTIKLEGVIFENGETWGEVPPPPPPGIGPPGEGPPEIGPPGDGIQQRPRLLNRVYPSYTELARKNKVSGQVKMEILVGEDGIVREAKIIEGLPDGLNDEAIRAAHKMRFSPATRNGVPIEVWVGINMVFSLR